MSEIWTPGGSSKPAPSGGIELPKGFARRRDPEPTPETPAPPAQPAAPAEPPQGQPGQPQIAFPPQGAQIQCPNCGTPFVAPIFSILDFGINPELRGALLGGQINVAHCQACGFSAPLSAPLMVHDPEHEFLGVFLAVQAGLDDMTSQRVIGEMTQALMRGIPNEQRRGYMLNPSQFMDWEAFMEKMWEFEGVTPEMRKRQRDQMALIESLMKVAGDETAMNMVMERKPGLVDAEFMALLSYYASVMESQGQTKEAEAMRSVFNVLLETTEAGAEVKRQRAVVESYMDRIQPGMTPDAFLDIVVEAWMGDAGEAVLSTIIGSGAGQMLDYNFLMALTQRIDSTGDDETREKLIALRDVVTQVQQEMSTQSGSSRMEAATKFLQEVLQSTDLDATLRANAAKVDNYFFALIQNQMQQADEANAAGAVRRLTTIYQKAMAILEESMPADVRLINHLLSVESEGDVRKLLQENRDLLTPDFMDSLRALEDRSRQQGQDDLAARLKSIRGKVSLMM
jgi:hypothetical protein